MKKSEAKCLQFKAYFVVKVEIPIQLLKISNTGASLLDFCGNLLGKETYFILQIAF